MKNSILKIINSILAILLINQVLMALLHGLVPRKVFEVMHGGGGGLFAVAAVVHVILNWSWIKVNFFKKPQSTKR